MESTTINADEARLAFIREIAQIAFNYGHDNALFRKKVFEVLSVDSLVEKDVVKMEESILEEDMREALKERKLSDKEFELCCLLEHGFSKEELTVILGLNNTNSIEVKKSRIKKKVKGEATPEAVLVMLIMSIIAWVVLNLLSF